MSDIEAAPSKIWTEDASFEIGFRRQIQIAVRSFWASSVRNRILALVAALLAIILLAAYGQILLNRWNVPFYNALERRDLDGFIQQIGVFAMIAGALLLLNVIQTWLNQMTALYMREGLSRDVVDQWLTDRRAYRLSNSSPLGVNPDQRLHEDARKLAETTTSLAAGLVQATVLLVSFIGVLWQLSSDFTLVIGGHGFSIPGYMVWGALVYAGLASLLSQAVGWRLTRLNADRYGREADLRFALMRANENLEAIALAHGEETERRHIHDGIDRVLSMIRQLAGALTNLTWVTAGFGWLALIVPTLIASPAYFAGTMTFGGLMMAAAAFTQVYSALRWYVDNFGAIADWKATLFRVTVFKAALSDMEDYHPEGGGVGIERTTDGTFGFEDLVIRARQSAEDCDGAFKIREEKPLILPRERVMINGDQGVNRKLLFNAMADLWPRGSGTIRVPPDEEVLYLPQREYLPEGKLRSILAYPVASATFSDEQMIGVLRRVRLDRLIPMLDQRARWDRTLDRDEQVALSFANILLRRPRAVVFNDVLEGLEPDTVSTLAGLMTELSDTTMIYIGRSAALEEAVSPRVLHLQRLEPK